MRWVLPALGLAAFLAPGPADDTDQARAAVDRAIAAIGGEQKLQGLTAGTWKTSGVFQGKQSRAEFRGELPGRFRIDSTRIVDGKPVVFSRILDGDKGWVVEGEAVREMTPAEVEGVKTTFYHKQMATTLLPLKDKGCELKLVGPADVNGKPTTAVRAARKGFPDVTLHFDSATGLLVKTELTDKNPMTGKDRKVELEFGEYKEFDGVRMATRTKTYHDGKLFLEAEITEFKGAKSLPPGTFKP